MAARPILFDTTRLLTRLKHAAPTGVDRVDLAYARHFLRGAYEGRAAAATLFGVRLLPPRQLDELFSTIDQRWTESPDASRDKVLARLTQQLADRPKKEAAPAPAPARAPRLRLPVAEAGREARAFRWSGAAEAPRNAIYIHTSHLRLDRPQLFTWLDGRRDIRSVFFVHDIIPIEHPEYVVPGEAARHRTRMATVAHRAAALVVSSKDVESRVTRYLKAEKLRVPPIQVAPIGVEPLFLSRPDRPVSAARPYFVVCSTIEARKNHLLLLQVWRELAATMGAGTPALIIVGRRGWESENVVDLLDRCPAIQDHVHEASGLSTPGLVSLLAGARALLMPSFAEGYGIPVVEALSLGTPVIASDLPVHREIGGRHATFLHPLDGLGWRDAITQAAATPRPTGQKAFKAPVWEDHFRAIDALISEI